LSEQPDVIRAQWRMAWESHSKQVREHGVLPAAVRGIIESSGVIKRLEGGHADGEG